MVVKPGCGARCNLDRQTVFDLSRMTLDDHRWSVVFFALTGAGVLAFFSALMAGFYVPAYDGVDENGYLVSAQRLATTGQLGKTTSDPYEFVSGNFVQTGPNQFQAKYPIGYPALCALAYKLGGPRAAFLVNPVLATLAVLGMYLLGRALWGDFAGALAALLLAANPLHAFYGLSAVSHSGAECFAVWGMYFLWRWSQTGGWPNAALTGLCCAYAYTVRYTEGLLLLPVAGMILVRGRQTAWREVGVMILAALVTAAPLLYHHWRAFGAPWVTGYALCGESTGFGWQWFQKNWWLMLDRMNAGGLPLVFPLGLAGLAFLAWRDRARAWLLALWALPPMALYTAYYWAPTGTGPGYVRFFVSIFPPLILSAVAWCCCTLGRGRMWPALAAGGFVLAAATANLHEGLQQLRNRFDRLIFADTTSRLVAERLPVNAVIFADSRVLNFIEYLGNYRLYSQEMFDRASIRRWTQVLDDDEPHPFHRAKALHLARTLGGKDNFELAQLLSGLVSNHLAAGRTVAVITPTDGRIKNWRGRLSQRFAFEPVARWNEPQGGPRRDPRPVEWAMYRLSPRQPGARPSRAARRVELQEKLDQLQFQIRNLREEFNENFPGAQSQVSKIQDLERQAQEVEEELRRLTKPLPAKTNPPTPQS